MNDWAPPLVALIELQQRLPRGPRREGALALWMTARIALDIGLSATGADRSERKRIALLAQRLRTMALPLPLQRGLTTVIAHLEEGTPGAARIALAQLVAPARDALGAEVAEAVAQTARMIHDHHRSGAPDRIG